AGAVGRVGRSAARHAAHARRALARRRPADAAHQHAASHQRHRARHVLGGADRDREPLMLRAVLFDLDGTLADTERQNAEAGARVLERLGRPLSEEEREFVIGHGWHEIYHHLVMNGGVTVGYEDLMHAAGVERVHIVETEGLDVLPGAVDTVRRFSERFASAVVSGSSRAEVEAVLRALDVLKCFPWFLGAEDTARGKPFPDGCL